MSQTGKTFGQLSMQNEVAENLHVVNLFERLLTEK